MEQIKTKIIEDKQIQTVVSMKNIKEGKTFRRNNPKVNFK